MLIGSESPTPRPSPARCLVDSPPGRLRSGPSGTPIRPSWLRTADIAHPLVRLARKRPPHRPGSPLRLELPPSSPWRVLPCSDVSEDTVLARHSYLFLTHQRLDTPDPRSSSALLTGTELLKEVEFQDCSDDELPKPQDRDEVEDGRSQASPSWSPLKTPFAIQSSLNIEDPPHSDLGLEELEYPRQLAPSSLLDLLSHDSLSQHGCPTDTEWQNIRTWIDQARSGVSRPRAPTSDKWGFATTRGMTIGYEPCQYNGNPSSEERKKRRRRLRPVSSIKFSTPSMRDSRRSNAEPHTPSPQISSPPRQLPQVPRWRGERLYRVFRGEGQHWRLPSELSDEDSDSGDSGGSEEDNKRKRKAKKGKRSTRVSEARQLSPASLEARETRIRHFNDINTYQLHVEMVLG